MNKLDDSSNDTNDSVVETPEECEECIDKIVGKKRRRAGSQRLSRKWHRWIGLLISLPLLWVTITGIILNHTVDWELDKKEVNTSWIKSHYGMTPSGEPQGVLINEQSVIEWDGVIFHNSKPLKTELEGKLIGALKANDELIIVTEYNALKLDQEGNAVEILDELSLPDLPLTGVAQQQQTLYLKNASGWHTPDQDWLEYTPAESAPFASTALSNIENQEIRSDLKSAWSRGGLPLSRIVLDLHSGRFFGTAGLYLYDLVSACTIILIITGIILFIRKPQRRRSRG